MDSAPTAGPAIIATRSENFHRWRSRKDQFAKRIIGLGGLMVIAAVLLILFSLAYVVAPLFMPASMSKSAIGANLEWGGDRTVYLSVEEQQQVALRLARRASQKVPPNRSSRPGRSALPAATRSSADALPVDCQVKRSAQRTC